MNRLSPLTLCAVLAVAAPSVDADTVVPLKGQSAQQTQLDINECNSVAANQAAPSTSGGGRLRGAAVGAAAGAAGAQVRGRQHDEFYERVDDDAKQDYRQNRAKETAVAGAVVGGSRQRQERRAERRTSDSTTATAYTSCLQGKGYQITP